MKKITGKVMRGKGKGRNLGFPTANVEIEEKIESGVYEGKVIITRELNDSRIGANEKRMRTNNSRINANAKRMEANEWLAGIFVKGNLLEAHLIGFSGDLYGKEISVEIVRKLREIQKFESEEKLVRQIRRDIGIISNS